MELVQHFKGNVSVGNQREIVSELHRKQADLGRAITRLKRYNGLE